MANDSDELAPGTRLAEFEIEDVLGAGGFGITYLARDRSLDAWRAMKEYMPRDWGKRRDDGTIVPRTASVESDYDWGLAQFLEEARTLARFYHPHIVHVYRVLKALGTAYMVTEYVKGHTLAAELKEKGPLPEVRVQALLQALTDGLSVVHAAGLLHLDIKPANVMLRENGTPVLIDFGSARQTIGRQSRDVMAVLTPPYAPIEQYSERGNQGAWTDIYSLGALAYKALSGEDPDESPERVPEDRLRPVADVVPARVSPKLATAVEKALSVYPDERPQTLRDWRRLWWEQVNPPPTTSAASWILAALRRLALAISSLRIWRRWVLASASAAALFGALMLATDPSPARAVFLSALVWAPQWLVLRRTVTQARWWVPASTAGLWLGVFWGLVVGAGAAASGFEVVADALVLASMTVGVATCQWLVLRRQVAHAGLWVPATSIGMGVAAAFQVSVDATLVGSELYDNVGIYLTVFTAAVIYGAITGVVLGRLLTADTGGVIDGVPPPSIDSNGGLLN